MKWLTRRAAATAAAATNGAARDVALVVVGKQGEKWFALGRHGCEPKQTAPKGAPIVIRLASHDDARELALSPIGQAKAEQQFVRAVNREDLAVINASKTLGVIYAADERESFGQESPVYPLPLLLDIIAKDRGLSPGAPRFDWLRLATGPDMTEGPAPVVACLLATTESGRLLASEVMIKPAKESLAAKNALTQLFASEKMQVTELVGISRSMPDEQRLERLAAIQNVVSVADLLAALAHPLARPLPREHMVGSMPVSKASRLIMAASAVAAFSGMAFAAVQTAGLVMLEKQATEAAMVADAQRRALNEGVSQRASALAAAVSLSPHELLTSAAAVWQPGTRVLLDANQAQRTLQLRIPLTRSGRAAGNDRRTILVDTPEEQIQSWANVPPPGGYTLIRKTLSGDLDAALVTFKAGPVDIDLVSVAGMGAPGVSGVASPATFPVPGQIQPGGR